MPSEPSGSPNPIAIPSIPFNFSSLNSPNIPGQYQQSRPYYPQGGDPNDIYSSSDDRDIPQGSHVQQPAGMAHNRPGLPYPPQGYPNHYSQQQHMPTFPSPFELPSMGVFNPSVGGPSSFTQMQPQQKKRPKYTRSKAGCLTCRTKKIKVRFWFNWV